MVITIGQVGEEEMLMVMDTMWIIEDDLSTTNGSGEVTRFHTKTRGTCYPGNVKTNQLTEVMIPRATQTKPRNFQMEQISNPKVQSFQWICPQWFSQSRIHSNPWHLRVSLDTITRA